MDLTPIDRDSTTKRLMDHIADPLKNTHTRMCMCVGFADWATNAEEVWLFNVNDTTNPTLGDHFNSFLITSLSSSPSSFNEQVD